MPTRVPSLREEAEERVERETGFEPATPSLEGWRSTAELFPRTLPDIFPAPGVVGRGGFEPPKASASRFTVCPLWPLGYLPACSPDCNPLVLLALAGGFEPPTHCLQGSCSTPELRQQSQNFMLVSNATQVKVFLDCPARRARIAPVAAPLRSTGRPPPPTRSPNPTGPSWARSGGGRSSERPAAGAPPPRFRAPGREGQRG